MKSQAKNNSTTFFIQTGQTAPSVVIGSDKMEALLKELSELEQVEAIVLGGSRSGKHNDEKSDYDLYIYGSEPVPEEKRADILEKYCQKKEIGNHYWEYEDNCILNNGVGIDIIYRKLEDIERFVAYVVEQYHAMNGYTTCFWHNVITSEILYDRDGKFAAMQKRFDIPYPKQLKENIIKRNMQLLNNGLPNYKDQILKAVRRNDRNSINHRTAGFLESYFDIIFALNEKTHPGEKRLVELCKKQCEILPAHFEKNLNRLFDDLLTNSENIPGDIERIITELKNTLQLQGEKHEQ